MASQHLKDLRAVWGESCHSMWIELLSIRCTHAHLLSQYGALSDRVLLTEIVYSPESKGRLNDITPAIFIKRLDRYLQAVVTDRVVLLSAAFEQYFWHFLDDYLKSKRKYFDPATAARTAEGHAVFGSIKGTRGLAERITSFSVKTGSKIGSINPKLRALSDVYLLRNVLAHRAGQMDEDASGRLQTVCFAADQRVVLSTDELLRLAAPVLDIASILDGRLS